MSSNESDPERIDVVSEEEVEEDEFQTPAGGNPVDPIVQVQPAVANMSADDNSTSAVTSKISIPYFNPEENKITARAWLSFVELARKSQGKKNGDYVWSTEQVTVNAMMLLQGTASKWIEAKIEVADPITTNWDAFKVAFKKRFVTPLSLTEKMNLTEIKQTSKDSVRDFYDRCVTNYHLYYEDEWEQLELDSQKVGENWQAPGEKVTQGHKTISNIFKTKAMEIQRKLTFAGGLKEAIKKQVLFQDSETIEDILKIAQRVEAGLKEINQKTDIGITNADDSEEENQARIDAFNFKNKRGGRNGGNGKPRGKAGNGKGATPNNQSFSCFYCFKQGHYKGDCMSRKNDRAKGIYKGNVNAPISTRGKSKANVNAIENNNNEDSDDSEEDEGPNAEIGMADMGLSGYLNYHTAQ